MRLISKTLTLVFCIILATSSFASFNAPENPSTKLTIPQIADNSRNLTAFLKLVKIAGLEQTLSKPGPFTVFAPTNTALNKLTAESLINLMLPKNRKILRAFLLYHVVKGKIFSDQMKSSEIKSLIGLKIKITKVDGKVMLNGKSKLFSPDIEASNGVIHMIDRVLIPPKKTN